MLMPILLGGSINTRYINQWMSEWLDITKKVKYKKAKKKKIEVTIKMSCKK